LIPSVYPNPVDKNGRVYLASELSSGTLSIYNALGEHIRSISFDQPGNKKMEVDLSGMDTGIYLLYVLSPAGLAETCSRLAITH
jgi:hypothetical protein